MISNTTVVSFMFCRLVSGFSGAGWDQRNYNAHVSLHFCVVAPHIWAPYSYFVCCERVSDFPPSLPLSLLSVSSLYHYCPHKGNKLLAVPIRRCLNETVQHFLPLDSDFRSAFCFSCCPCTGLIFSWQSGTNLRNISMTAHEKSRFKKDA